MKKIKDMMTSSQLMSGFGLIILMMLVLGLVAWRQADKLAQQTLDLYEHPLMVRMALGTFSAEIMTIHRDMKDLILSKDQDEECTALLAQIEISKAKALRQLDLLEANYLGPVDDIEALRVEFVQWNTIREETIRLLRQGKTKEAVDRTRSDGIDGAQARRVQEKAYLVDDFSRKKANLFSNQAIQLNNELQIQLLMFILVALTVSLLIAAYMSRLISHPLSEIVHAIDSYRSGIKSARSGYASKNQFGQLSGRFNEMAETLETEYLISNRAAELTGLMLREDDAHRFCHDMLNNLLKHTQSQMGAVYLLNEDKTLFEHFESIGIDVAVCNAFTAINPEGEFGLALAAKKISHLQNIPEDSRFIFNTVSGRYTPREIITIPVYDGRQAVAVISLSSIHSYSATSLRLIENIFDMITARMNGILAYRQVLTFLNKLEEQNTELDAQSRELLAMADELKQQNVELEVQKHQLGEVSRLKTDFLANMSHELRTPLNSVIALSGVLSRRLTQKIGEEEYGYLEVIERNAKHLLNLINDILDLSRIESGNVEVEKSSFNINALIVEVVDMIKPQADQKNIRLTFAGEKSDLVVESDYNKCLHIFQNIIGNAVKFTEKGGVDITVSVRDGNAVVRVSDTGVGISQAELPSIFDEFRQADGSHSRKYGGTGLGLSIAKKYADWIGCDIRVESELGKGSVFMVCIPVLATYQEQETLSLQPEIIQNLPYEKIRPKGDGKTILLVEDADAIIVQITDILEPEGYSVVSAQNGLEALRYLEKNIPDAVILDLMMPGMDGFELLNTMRGRTPTAEVPVLVMTAKILGKDELKEIKNNHVHQLIQKGRVTRDNLLEAIALLMLKKTDTLNQTRVVPVTVEGKPVVLAVEDNADNRLALKALIGDRYELVEARDGAEGIAQALKHLPHLILMDIALPRMNGFEALREIRQNPALKHIPVLAVTSNAMKGDKTYFIEFGFNGYVSKPVIGEMLFDEINRWLVVE